MDWGWYVLLGVLLALAGAAPTVLRRLREFRLSRAGLSNVAEMTDQTMVEHMARLFGALGYRVFRTAQESSTFDLLLADGLGQKRGVLIRRWRQLVDADAVALVAEKAELLGNAAPMVVTVEGYTWAARQAAVKSGVILWSLPELTEAIGRVRQSAIAYPELPELSEQAFSRETAPQPADGAKPSDALAMLMQPLPGAEPKRRKRPERMRPGDRGGSAWDPTSVPKCPRCGKKMVVRRSVDGEYWGCPNFPRCLGTRPKR